MNWYAEYNFINFAYSEHCQRTVPVFFKNRPSSVYCVVLSAIEILYFCIIVT